MARLVVAHCDDFVTKPSLSGNKAGSMGLPMTQPPSVSRLRGFSLVELLCVIAVIALMMALIAPAISGLSGTSGRRGAVNIVMNTLEQARVAALESGRDVHVLFFRNKFPEPDSMMVVRETESGTGDFERLTRTTKLPKGVLFHAAPNSLIAQALPPAFDLNRVKPTPASSSYDGFSVLTFNSSGAVSFPSDSATVARQLFLTEGIRGANESALTARKQQQTAPGGGFEVISLSRYTGRAQLDISATGS